MAEVLSSNLSGPIVFVFISRNEKAKNSVEVVP